MTRHLTHLQRYVNAMPFADWFARVQLRLERRTGERCVSNEAPMSYWQGLYQVGESWRVAADSFILDRRAGR